MNNTVLLSRGDVTRLLSIEECMDAVEMAFKLYAEGKVQPPKVLGIHAADGGFHIKAGIMNLKRNYFVAKTNANFPGNPKKLGLPTIQGVVEVFDADNGRLLALLDSMEITVIRTGAATGVAAKYLSKKDSKAITICGCGNQGRISLKGISSIRKIEKVFAADVELANAEKLVQDFSSQFDVSVVALSDLKQATLQSDIIVTATTSRKAFISGDYIKSGTFIAAVGADSEDKHEIEPAVIANSKLVVDLTEQSASIGDFRHALQAGAVSRSHVHAEIGEIITGKKSARTSDDEIIVFDSTGTALQDVVAAAIVYEKAMAGETRAFNFAQ